MNISVIIPVYNTSKYLKRCINSILNQTLKKVEIIIINDCSTDNSREILEEYRNCHNIKIIHNKKNMGIGYTRNMGIECAAGKYIAFIDSDDFVDENMFNKMFKKAEKENLDVVICRFHKMLEKENNILEEVEPNYIIPYFENTTLKDNPNLLLDINLAPWNKIYKKDLFTNDVRFPENLKYEDAIVVVKLLARAKKIGMLEDKLNYYLVRKNSESTTMNKKIFDIITINDQILQELKSHSYYDDIKSYVEKKMIKSFTYWMNQQQYQNNQKIANKFIEEATKYLNKNFPNWQNKCH